jgi:DNA invertase Pin-like site-specific DNA recombinase
LTCSSLANSYPADRAASRNPQLNLRVPEEVQQRIRELSASGMTRTAIAKELGVSTGAVSKYKKPPA